MKDLCIVLLLSQYHACYSQWGWGAHLERMKNLYISLVAVFPWTSVTGNCQKQSTGLDKPLGSGTDGIYVLPIPLLHMFFKVQLQTVLHFLTQASSSISLIKLSLHLCGSGPASNAILHQLEIGPTIHKASFKQNQTCYLSSHAESTRSIELQTPPHPYQSDSNRAL